MSLNTNSFIFFLLLIFTILLTFFNHNKVSNFLNLNDQPNKRKLHKTPVPISGGIFIALNIFSFVILDFLFFGQFFSKNFINANNLFFILIFFVLGLYDDKFSLSANKKLFFSSCIILALIFFDQDLQIKQLHFKFLNLKFNIQSFSLFFTPFCIILFINACNMYDGINGQSGIFFIFFIFYIALITKFDLFLLFLIICLLLYLYLNLKGKSFIGDGGIFLISLLLSVIIIKKYNSVDSFYCDQIFLLMLLPGVEVLRLAIQRILNKKHPFKADQNHIHHLMLKKFKSEKVLLLNSSMIILFNIFGYLFDNYFLFIILSLITYIVIIFNFKNKYV